METVAKQLDQDLQHIPIILADVDDSKSLEAMAKKCKVSGWNITDNKFVRALYTRAKLKLAEFSEKTQKHF